MGAFFQTNGIITYELLGNTPDNKKGMSVNENENKKLIDVFQPGLRRGSARLPFDPKKKYAFVEHPTQGWRVYLRSAVFIHEAGRPIDPKHFLVVKRTGARMTTAAWEPPKGQMEGKDLTGVEGKNKTLLQVLKENARRETAEESYIEELEDLEHTGLIFQSQESSYPANHYFQYHIFRAKVGPEALAQSFRIFEWIQGHRKEFATWSRDIREKDAIAWFNPRTTQLNPRWCPSMFVLYLNAYKQGYLR